MNDLKKTTELHEIPQELDYYCTISGRIVFLRDLGKLLFIKITDINGIFQISLKKDNCENFESIKSELSRGDIITVYGFTYKTVAGELTLQVEKCQIDVKCINALPEKWAGIRDDDLKQRYRYLDFIQNEQTRNVFFTRQKIMKSIRDFLINRGFIEVETPILQPVPSGAAATPFITHHQAIDQTMYLRIAPEFYLKRMIIAGYNKVFEMGKCFRNEGIDTTHLQEFTMLETYEAYMDYEGLMQYAKDLLNFIASNINHKKYDFKNMKSMTYYEFLESYGNLDIKYIHDYDYLIKIAKLHNLDYKNHKTHQTLIDFIYKKLCVSKIVDPLLIYDYPHHPLAKPHDTNPKLSKKFQVILEHQEIINAYVEQNDPNILDQEFNRQETYANLGEEEIFVKDNDFVDAVRYGLVPCGGFGMGIDRLTKLLTGADSIKDVVFFPIMKPLQ
jgi:lysyl-tRNA synthetase class 2